MSAKETILNLLRKWFGENKEQIKDKAVEIVSKKAKEAAKKKKKKKTIKKLSSKKR